MVPVSFLCVPLSLVPLIGVLSIALRPLLPPHLFFSFPPSLALHAGNNNNMFSTLVIACTQRTSTSLLCAN